MGSEITINYIDIETTKENRQKEYIKCFAKSCECDKCVNNLDKDINYDKYEELMTRNLFYIKSMNNKNKVRFLSNFEIDSELIAFMREIYGEYHPKVSTILLLSFVCFSIYSKKFEKSLVKKWLEEIVNNILITHGSEHPLYKMFRQFSTKMNII